MSEATAETSMDLTGTAVRALLLYALAEFQSGHATTIRITAEGTSFSITDNGRGHSLDRTVEGTPYLKFVYLHFDYPFDSGQALPIQLQGIGMSFVNTLCSDFALTVRKQDEMLQLRFRNGNLHDSNRTKTVSGETGIAVSGTINPQLSSGAVDGDRLRRWLLGVSASSPALKLFFNGHELKSQQENET